MKKLAIYLDTSVFSAYLDERTPSRMDLTQDFWKSIDDYDKYISNVVLEELDAITDNILKEKVLKLTEGFEILHMNDEVKNVAHEYLKVGIIPEKEINDALHLAFVTVNQVDILLSWNFKHLVKRKTRILVNLVNCQMGYKHIDLLAPPEL